MIQHEVDHFRALKGSQAGGYRNATLQFRNVLDGSDTEGIKAKYYPGWTDEDIEDLLTELGEPAN